MRAGYNIIFLIFLVFLLGLAAPAMANGGGESGAPSPYFKFDPNFISNVLDKNGMPGLLQVRVELIMDNPEDVEFIKKYEPRLRNDVLALLSIQKKESLVTLDGQEQMRKLILAVINKSMEEEISPPAPKGKADKSKDKPKEKEGKEGKVKVVKVKQVLLTQFLIQ